MKDFAINNILDLQIALIENNNPAINNYIERLDRETSNQCMRQAGEHFGFPTVEIEGVVRTSVGHLARVFGYKTAQGLANLLERRGISGIKVGGFVHDVQIKIRETLGMEKSDHKSVLYDWPAFLIGGMNTTNDAASVVQAYLLRMEQVARVGIIAVRHGQIRGELPEPVHAMCMTKLADRAWKGNPIAAYILEHHYGIPVSQLMHRTDPEASETAAHISQYLHFIIDSRLTTYGLSIKKTAHGFAIEGKGEQLYTSFLEIARRHRLQRFFTNANSLGCILSREADALETIGWRRSICKISKGYRISRYEQCQNLESTPALPEAGESEALNNGQ